MTFQNIIAFLFGAVISVSVQRECASKKAGNAVWFLKGPCSNPRCQPHSRIYYGGKRGRRLQKKGSSIRNISDPEGAWLIPFEAAPTKGSSAKSFYLNSIAVQLLLITASDHSQAPLVVEEDTVIADRVYYSDTSLP